jgi:hypothetical protein
MTMGRMFFVEPETVRLPLFDDGLFWVSVKKELTGGEQKQITFSPFGKATRTGGDEESNLAWDMNFEGAAFLKILLWLVDWNVPDNVGKTVDIVTSPKAKKDALKALTVDALKEIERVIDAHALAVEKNAPSGVATPTPTMTT